MTPLACAAARVSDLRAVLQHEADRKCAFLQPGGESFALHQLHHEVIGTDIVERADVRMIQCGDGARLALEACAELLSGDLLLQNHRPGSAL